jgi:hypothetical protein
MSAFNIPQFAQEPINPALVYSPFNQFGDLERVMLRRGNQHSAKFWRQALLPVIARYLDLKMPKFLRGDAAFASP